MLKGSDSQQPFLLPVPIIRGIMACCTGSRLANRSTSHIWQTSGGAKTLKPKCVLVAVTFLALMSVTPALAAPREIEEFCFEQAQRATLTLRKGAGEAFMANCVADLTPTPTKKRKYRRY